METTEIIPKDTIKVIGQMNGLDISDDVAQFIAYNTENVILHILQEANKFMKRSKRNHLTVDDINLSLRLKNFEELYGYSCDKVIKYKKVSGQKGFYIIEDQEIDISHMLNYYELPPCPVKVSYGLHWLAIDGYQPSIPQNQPKFRKIASRKSAIKEETDNIITEEVEVKPNDKHIISKELQIYYDSITKSLSSNDDNIIQSCLERIQNDPVIQHLLPYLCLYIKNEVRSNISNINTILMFIRNIFNNTNIYIDNYLHYFIPVLISCIVFNPPIDINYNIDHWKVREDAADLIHLLCQRYGDQYKNIRPRILKILVNTLLNLDMPLSAHYGCITAILKIEKDLKNILPISKKYCKYLYSLAEQNENQKKKTEALKIISLLKQNNMISDNNDQS